MMPSCIRCQGRTTIALTYRHSDVEAFLDGALGHEKVHDGIFLCELHASRFSAPRGWATVDRRSAMDEPEPPSRERIGR